MDQILKKPFFERERVIGFVLYFVVSASLWLAQRVFSDSATDVVAMVIYFVTSVLFVVALFGLTHKQYKYYAQGALIGWLVYFIVTVFSTTLKMFI